MRNEDSVYLSYTFVVPGKTIAFPAAIRRMENLGKGYRLVPGVERVSEEILTIQEVAKLLKVADKTIYTMAQKGDLPAFKVGGLWRFRRQDLDVWISERVGRAGQASASDRTNEMSTKKRKART